MSRNTSCQYVKFMARLIAQSYEHDLLDDPSPKTRMVHSDPGPVVPTRCLYPADTCPEDISSLCRRGLIVQLSDQHNHKRPKRARVYSAGTHEPAERSFVPTDPACCGRPTTITVLCPGETRRTAEEADARKGTPLLTSHTICSIPALHATGPADK